MSFKDDIEIVERTIERETPGLMDLAYRIAERMTPEQRASQIREKEARISEYAEQIRKGRR